MKVCLHCKKEFQEKKETAKYCSTSCRVMYNRKLPKKNKEVITEPKLQVIYNSILDIIERFESAKSLSFETGLPENKNGSVGVISHTTNQNLGLEKTVQQHMNEIADLQFEEEYKKKATEIESATNLSRKQKDLLILNMNAPKM